MKENAREIHSDLKFCQEPSSSYLQMLDECGGDPKSVEGCIALRNAGNNAERGWEPTWEARDARK